MKIKPKNGWYILFDEKGLEIKIPDWVEDINYYIKKGFKTEKPEVKEEKPEKPEKQDGKKTDK